MGLAMQHYMCYEVYVPAPKPHELLTPSNSSPPKDHFHSLKDAILHAAHYLLHAICIPQPFNLLLQLWEPKQNVINKLAHILDDAALRVGQCTPLHAAHNQDKA